MNVADVMDILYVPEDRVKGHGSRGVGSERLARVVKVDELQRLRRCLSRKAIRLRSSRRCSRRPHIFRMLRRQLGRKARECCAGLRCASSGLAQLGALAPRGRASGPEFFQGTVIAGNCACRIPGWDAKRRAPVEQSVTSPRGVCPGPGGPVRLRVASCGPPLLPPAACGTTSHLWRVGAPCLIWPGGSRAALCRQLMLPAQYAATGTCREQRC